ncbi:hypothetical protein V5O48_014116, partial [Marasmius crinis-equi]
MSIPLPLDSSKWRKAAFTISIENRTNLASAALEKTVANLTSDGQFHDPQYYYQLGIFYSQMAEFDLVRNQTQYKDKLLAFLQARDSEREAINPFLRDGLTHGYAAARSYLAYQDPACLEYAINWWKWAQGWTITEAEVASGSVQGKDFTLQKECSNETVAGGTFDISVNRKNGVVSLMASGLSSLLREATSNQTYLDSAASSFNFVRMHLLPASGYLPQHSIVLDSGDSAKCTVAGWGDSSDAGEWIEALATYNSISSTVSGEELLLGAFENALTSGDWHTSDEILEFHPEALMSNLNLPRGLTAYHQRNTSSEVRTDIEKYLAVQYNAILDQATISGSNLYNPNWAGPPSSQPELEVNAQITAQQVLIAAISLSRTETGTVTPPSGNGNESGSGSPHSKSKALVGGIVGGVVGLVSILLLLWFVWKRHRRSRSQTHVGKVEEGAVVEPFGVRKGEIIQEIPRMESAASEVRSPVLKEPMAFSTTSEEVPEAVNAASSTA